MELSKFIRNYLDKNDLSQRELARRCGLSPQTVTNALKGENAIDIETLAKFANGMGYPNARYASINGVAYIEIPELPAVENDDSEITAFQMKFAALDAHGKRIVSALLDAEFDRCMRKVVNLDEVMMVARNGKKMDEATKADAQKMAEIIFGDKE
jgi:transcriptional regulator with XRE-family HTH domain